MNVPYLLTISLYCVFTPNLKTEVKYEIMTSSDTGMAQLAMQECKLNQEE